MAVPQCTITGEASALFGDLTGDGLLTAEDYDGVQVVFTPNVSATELIPIDGVMRTVESVNAVFDGGVLKRVNDDGSLTTDVELLGNGPEVAFNLEWTITFPGKAFRLNGFTKTFSKWSFVSPEDGETKDLSELPRLFKAATAGDELVQSAVLGAMVDAKLDEEIPPKLDSTVPVRITEDIEGRPFEAIEDEDNPGNLIWRWGDAYSPSVPGTATTWGGVAGRQAGVRQLTGGIVPLEDFNPAADPIQALDDAITEADANGGTVVAYTAKDYIVEEGLTVTDKHVRFNANGARFIRAASSLTDDYIALNIVHTSSTPQAVVGIDNAALFTPDWPNTLRVLSRVARIEVASTAGWSVNDYAVIVSDDQITSANPDRAAQYKGDRARIAAVIGNYLYTTMPLRETFTTNVRVARMTQKDVFLDDPWGEDELGSPSGRISPFINIRGAVGPRVNNWRPRNLMSMGLKFEGCVNGRVNGVDAYNLRTNPPNAYGYGVWVVSSTDFTIRNPDGEQLRHIVTTGQGSNMSTDSPDLYRYGRCINVNQTDGRAGQTGHAAYDLHEEAMDCVIEGNSVDFNHREPDGTAAAIQMRGMRNTARGNRTRGPGGIKLYGYDGGGDWLVEGNTFETLPGIYGTAAFGLQFDNTATASSTRLKANLRNNTWIWRGMDATDTGLLQLKKASVKVSNERLITYNASAVTSYRPVWLTDSDLSGDLEFDLTGISGTVRAFYLADSLSSVALGTLKVTTGGASWGIGHFNSLNGSITIGRIECDTIPASTLVSNMGTTATLSIGDVIVNGQSRKDGLANYTNSGATVTLNALAFGRQQLAVPITATRTVTESTLALHVGRTIKFTRTAAATGAFSWVIGSDALTTAGTWLERTWDGTAWYTSAKGSL